MRRTGTQSSESQCTALACLWERRLNALHWHSIIRVGSAPALHHPSPNTQHWHSIIRVPLHRALQCRPNLTRGWVGGLYFLGGGSGAGVDQCVLAAYSRQVLFACACHPLQPRAPTAGRESELSAVRACNPLPAGPSTSGPYPKLLQALDVVRPPWAPAPIPVFPSDEGVAARASDCDGCGAPRPAGGGGAGHAGGSAGRSGPPGGARPPVQDAAAEVQDLVNCLGALSGAAGVYLVPRLQGPVPAPMGSG